MHKELLLGILLLVIFAGCDNPPEVSEPTLEKTPWLFPGPLTEQLSHPDFRARALAARRLGEMGAEAEVAISELEKLLEDENPRVCELAEEALGKIREAVGDK